MSVGGHHGHFCGGEAGAKEVVVAYAHLPTIGYGPKGGTLMQLDVPEQSSCRWACVRYRGFTPLEAKELWQDEKNDASGGLIYPTVHTQGHPDGKTPNFTTVPSTTYVARHVA